MSANLPPAGQAHAASHGTLPTAPAITGVDRATLLAQCGAQTELKTAALRALDQMEADLLAEEHDAQKLGRLDAARRAADLRHRIDAAQPEAIALIESVAALDREIAIHERQAQEAEAAGRPRRIAVAGRNRAASASRVQEAALALRAAIFADIEAAAELGTAIGTGQAQQKFGIGFVAERLRYGLFDVFRRDYQRGPREIAAGRPVVADLLIRGDAINPASRFCKMSFPQIEADMLDDYVHLFETRPDAEASCRRRDPTGRFWHVRPGPDGLFEVVQGELRGAAKSLPGAGGTP